MYVQLLLLLLFLTFSVLVANPEKTSLHGGELRSTALCYSDEWHNFGLRSFASGAIYDLVTDVACGSAEYVFDGIAKRMRLKRETIHRREESDAVEPPSPPPLPPGRLGVHGLNDFGNYAGIKIRLQIKQALDGRLRCIKKKTKKHDTTRVMDGWIHHLR